MYVHFYKLWRQKKRPYRKIISEALKIAVARVGVAAMDLASFYRTQPKRLPHGALHNGT
jgi:hypothetical protein